MRPEFFLLLAIYLIVLVLVGLKFSRRMKSLEDFFLASRSLPASLVFLSLTASWFGATSILVTTDEAYRVGLSAIWLVGLPAAVTVLIFAGVLAGTIRRLEILTLPDLVEMRYGKTVRRLAALVIFWYMVVLASSQLVALGQFLKPFLRLPYFWSLVLATGAVLVYLVAGGLLSVVATDVLQCFLLAGGVFGLTFYLIGRSSGAPHLGLGAGEGREYLNLFSDFRFNALVATSFILAWTISPIAWQRVQAARTAKKARLGLLASAGAFIVLYGAVVLIGVLSRSATGPRRLTQPLLSEIISSDLSLWAGGVLFIAVVAAILSTMDTAVNTGALTLTREFLARIPSAGSKPKLTPVMAGRVATGVAALLAFLVATRFQSILQTLGLSSEIMAEGLFVPGIAMLRLRDRRPLAGGLSLAFGGGFALAGFLSILKVVPVRLPAWPYSVPYGVALSLCGFVVGYLLDSLRQRREND